MEEPELLPPEPTEPPLIFTGRRQRKRNRNEDAQKWCGSSTPAIYSTVYSYQKYILL
jgi:hypothetical protein